MKHLWIHVILSILALSCKLNAQEFVIGAQWMNYSATKPDPIPSDRAWWDSVRVVGLKWGMFETTSNDANLDDLLTYAHDNYQEFKIALQRHQSGHYGSGNCTGGEYIDFATARSQRYVFQSEYTGHYDSLDGHATGSPTSVVNAIYDVDDKKYPITNHNCWYGDKDIDGPGYLLIGLKVPAIPPSTDYFARARMRVAEAGSLNNNDTIAILEVTHANATADVLAITKAILPPGSDFFESSALPIANATDIADVIGPHFLVQGEC